LRAIAKKRWRARFGKSEELKVEIAQVLACLDSVFGDPPPLFSPDWARLFALYRMPGADADFVVT